MARPRRAARWFAAALLLVSGLACSAQSVEPRSHVPPVCDLGAASYGFALASTDIRPARVAEPAVWLAPALVDRDGKSAWVTAGG